ncbi:hypothetical protein Dacet_2421 [Denitrovibrio acetiphilus DSM 12809]|uniref:Thioredoxin-like fold domain-containing protein n=1 Tax=Denitrovibrio acetiphilus (strain DSM 12809 / NBRC 114555 / N2460) TaxID=522772 RepID=D4H3T1_DENA2|nr:hypothetical protein [Denitrovibrio acetiphilus]ADD69183.1 hypothetical protein Dacet_2421 [Denitrovibrio acetiphilus DSM 12809]
MLKIEVFYDGTEDNETPLKAEEIREKYGNKVDLYLLDISEETAPAVYGTINPPAVVLDGKQVYKLEGASSLAGIVKNAIF